MGDNWSKNFLRSVLSEDDGSGSSTRLIMVMLVSFIVGVGSAFAFKVHGPVTLAEYGQFLTSASAFIMATCGPLYLINKGADAINNKTEATASVPTATSTSTTTVTLPGA